MTRGKSIWPVSTGGDGGRCAGGVDSNSRRCGAGNGGGGAGGRGWRGVLVQTAFPVELSLGDDGFEVDEAFLQLLEHGKEPLGLWRDGLAGSGGDWRGLTGRTGGGTASRPMLAQEGPGKHGTQGEYPKNGVAVVQNDDAKHRTNEDDGEYQAGMGVRLSIEYRIEDGLS